MTTIQTPYHILRERDLDHTDEAIELLEAWDEWKYGKRPSTVAAGAYYAAAMLLDDLVDALRQLGAVFNGREAYDPVPQTTLVRTDGGRNDQSQAPDKDRPEGGDR